MPVFLRALYYNGYSPVGDVIVISIVVIFFVLIKTVYITPTKEFRIFKTILALIVLAALSNLVFHMILPKTAVVPTVVIYAVRIIYHLALFGSLSLYIRYMETPLQLEMKQERVYYNISLLFLIVFALVEIIGTIRKTGFYIDGRGVVHSEHGFIFALSYTAMIGLLLYMMIKYSDRIYRPLIVAFLATTIVSVLIMFLQGIFGQNSFTTATFVFPAFSVLYLLHGHPYDPEMGTLHMEAFEERILHAKASNTRLIIMGLLMREFEQPGKKYPKEIRVVIREYVTNFLKGATVFQISGGRMVMIAPVAQNPDYENIIKRMLDVFYEKYEVYRLDFKLVITESLDRIEKPHDYLRFIEYIENRMPENEVRRVGEEELTKFEEHRYIVDQLADINEKKDMLDPRVTVFCQPVFNVRTGKYDTAESLMRLTLEKTGMVFPDRFIPIAEKHNYIHTLSMIILAKTCQQVKKLMDGGYLVKRISVNFSILDVREKSFSSDVKRIIENSGIPYEKIAIEITESQNESDFITIKEKITELKDSGITFYLDDFGTGYSSFERIMELPFDIIKFDRSLVQASVQNPKAETMVSYLAHMFTDMNYSVLYEGIEDEKDEKLCISMYARYLQGYKYSRPIPIEKLEEFFEKK